MLYYDSTTVMSYMSNIGSATARDRDESWVGCQDYGVFTLFLTLHHTTQFYKLVKISRKSCNFSFFTFDDDVNLRGVSILFLFSALCSLSI